MSAVSHDPPERRGAPFAGWRQRLRAGFTRFVMATLAGLILAAIVHIVTVLAIPALSQRDAAHAYRELGTEGHAEMAPSPGNARGLPALREADPNVVTAICSYDLSTGPMRIVARTGTLLLGLTLHRQGGGVLYAITDRAAIRGTLEFLVMTEAQRDERRRRGRNQPRAAHRLRYRTGPDRRPRAAAPALGQGRCGGARDGRRLRAGELKRFSIFRRVSSRA